MTLIRSKSPMSDLREILVHPYGREDDASQKYARDVDEIVDGVLGVLGYVEHGKIMLGEDVGKGRGIAVGRNVVFGNKEVAFSQAVGS